MATPRRKRPKKQDEILKRQRQATESKVDEVEPMYPADSQATTGNADHMSPAGLLQLQHAVGNLAVGQLLAARGREQVDEGDQPSIQRNPEQEEEELVDLECPGSKIRSGGEGRGEGTGEGAGPIGYPKDEEW